MKLLKKASLSLLALATVSVTAPNFANAEGFALQDWSARGASLAGGLVARGGDASAVAYNPAAITELEGTQVMAGGEIISLTNTITGNGVKSESKDKLYFAPHGYITHKASDSISLGLGIYSRYGLGNEHDENWFGKYELYNIELLTSSVTPVIAWRVNDKLSLALGFEFMGAMVDLDKKQNLAPGVDADAKLSGDAFGKGINLSAHYRFNDQWKAGFVYRSHVTLDFGGELELITPLAIQKVNGSAKLYTPDSYTLALAYYPTEKLSFEGQVQYNTWSNYNSLSIVLPNPLGTQTEVKNWNDTWLFSLSTEYQYNDWLTLRAGISHETSPVPQGYADYIAPVNGRWKYAAGFGIAKNNWTFDMSYVYHDIKDLSYNDTTTAGVVKPGSTSDVNAHTVGLSIGYKF